MARPKKKIDPEEVQRLAMIHCTMDEIAAVLDCGKRTLDRRFGAVIKEGRAIGRRSLRRAQWKAVQSGNVTMMIWLGKQLLGQRDKRELTGADGAALKFSLDIGDPPGGESDNENGATSRV